MNIATAIFECSAPDLAGCPEATLPEFAFIGRSNVGKSSLVNLLTGRDGLAKVSPMPGFTKLLNFFVVNKRWRLVDLPGYGYAQVARKDSAQFNEAVMEYLQERENLFCTFILVDSKLEPQKLDLEFIQAMGMAEVPFVLVFTKTDALSKPVLVRNMNRFREAIAGWFEEPPLMLSCSAKEGRGKGELLGVIEETLRAEGVKPQSGGKGFNPKKVDPRRPW